MTKNDSRAAILDVQTHGRAEAEKIAPLLLINRCGERSAAPRGQLSWPCRDRPLLDFLGGAACLLVWGALWSLLISGLVQF